MIRRLEEVSLSAWPALQTLYYDGWLLRFADGYTRRANSVNAVYDSTLPLDEKIARCEQLYAARGLPTIFKMTEAVHPHDLDAVLEARGYTAEAHTSVQTVDLAQMELPAAPLFFSSTPDEDWLALYCRLNEVDPARIPVMRAMLGSIVPAVAYARLEYAGETAAVGLAVADGAYAGLFDLVVDARWRGRGLGRGLVTGLLAWGRAQGAQTGYLQVMLNNVPAQRLYANLGFREAYRYWYWVRA